LFSYFDVSLLFSYFGLRKEEQYDITYDYHNYHKSVTHITNIYIWFITFRIARYKVYTDYVLEVYKVDLLVLGTLLSSLMLTNTRFLFGPNTWNQVVTSTICYDKWQIQI